MAKGRRLTVEQMTIEQLAQRSGVTTRNIRAYQTKGLLPPPGFGSDSRVGIYDGSHLSRLRLIARLQDAGFSLAGVARLLDAWDAGHTLEQVLGIDQAVESARDHASLKLRTEDLGKALPEGFADADAIAVLQATGVLVATPGGFELRHPLLLEMAREATAGGVPASVMLEELRQIERELREIARRFVSHFHRYVSGPYVKAGMPLEQLPELQQTLGRLRMLAQHLLAPLMSEALDREAEVLMRKLLPRPADDSKEDVAKPKTARRSRRKAH